MKRGRTEPPRSRVKPGQPPTGVPKILRTDIRDGFPGDPGQQDIALDVTGKGIPSRTGAKGYGNPTGFRKTQVPPHLRHPSPVGLPSLPRPLQGEGSPIGVDSEHAAHRRGSLKTQAVMGQKQFVDPFFAGPAGHLFQDGHPSIIPFARVRLYHGMSLRRRSFPFFGGCPGRKTKRIAPRKAQPPNYFPALETG